VAVIFTTGVSSSLAAKAATSMIPLVFLSQDDPVKLGLVATFNRPGGNATGMAALTGHLVAKRLELVRQLVPTDGIIGYLHNPHAPEAAGYLNELQLASRNIGQQIIIVDAGNEADLDTAFDVLVQERAVAIVVATDGYLFSRRNRIIALAAARGIPAIYDRREYVVSRGLMSYGTHVPEAFRQIGIYTSRVLKGEKPAELPVFQPTKFNFVINVSTANGLGVDVPPTLFALADEVIE
jgi:putative ABC transport system substrate-binding protein